MENEPVHAVSVITPPAVTETIVEEAGRLGIQHIWLQPGAESETAIRRGEQLGFNIIHGGPCVLVVFGYREQMSGGMVMTLHRRGPATASSDR